jgi:glycosyltransferase involved in cell wall biosynthesis
LTNDNVVYVLPDKMGGALNIVAGLVTHRATDAMPCHAVLTHNSLSRDTRSDAALAVDAQTVFEYALPVENLHRVLRRLARALPAGGGVLVANDLLELALLHVHDPRRAVVFILHGDWDYYYDLAERHEAVVDVFVAYSRQMWLTLSHRLPHRAADILHLPYGVTLPGRVRHSSAGPLKVLFCGRITEVKGVHDLPAIARAVRDRGVAVEWTVIGDGPERDALRHAWTETPVQWRGPLAHSETLAALPEFDVFVLPTRAEGFPVALVEAMAAGLVPIVSDIASGVPEVVETGVNGFRPAPGDIDGFAAAIEQLASNRPRLDAMSAAARATVEARYDVRVCARAYEAVYARWRDLRRPRPSTLPLPYGSRLDRPWLPNTMVRAVRSTLRRAQGKPL